MEFCENLGVFAGKSNGGVNQTIHPTIESQLLAAPVASGHSDRQLSGVPVDGELRVFNKCVADLALG